MNKEEREKVFWEDVKKHNDKISGDGVALVDHDYYWRPINEAPHGVMPLLRLVCGLT